MKKILQFLIMAAAFAAGGSINANTFPAGPVTIIVPTTAGGIADAAARKVAEKLGELWNQPVIIDNRPGAGTLIGAQHFIKQKPDGHTLFMGFNELAALPAIYPNSKIDVKEQFVPIGRVITMPLVLMAKSTFPARDHTELVEILKTKPKEYTYGSNGNGSILQLQTELYSRVVGVDMLHIPYRGAQEAITGLIADQVDVVLTVAAPNVVAFVENGRTSAYVVGSRNRVKRLPDVPTMTEAGYPQFDEEIWYGLFAPQGTDPKLIDRLNTDLKGVLDDTEVADYFISMGAILADDIPAEFAAYFDTQHEKLGQLVKELDIATK